MANSLLKNATAASARTATPTRRPAAGAPQGSQIPPRGSAGAARSTKTPTLMPNGKPILGRVTFGSLQVAGNPSGTGFVCYPVMCVLRTNPDVNYERHMRFCENIQSSGLGGIQSAGTRAIHGDQGSLEAVFEMYSPWKILTVAGNVGLEVYTTKKELIYDGDKSEYDRRTANWLLSGVSESPNWGEHFDDVLRIDYGGSERAFATQALDTCCYALAIACKKLGISGSIPPVTQGYRPDKLLSFYAGFTNQLI